MKRTEASGAIGKFVRGLRKHHNMRQSDLSELLNGYRSGYLSIIEHGDLDPHVTFLLDIMQNLGLTTDQRQEFHNLVAYSDMPGPRNREDASMARRRATIFGDWLAEHMAYQSIYAEELARMCDMEPKTVAMLRCGVHTRVPIKRILVMMRALRVTMDDLETLEKRLKGLHRAYS